VTVTLVIMMTEKPNVNHVTLNVQHVPEQQIIVILVTLQELQTLNQIAHAQMDKSILMESVKIVTIHVKHVKELNLIVLHALTTLKEH